MTDSDKHPSLLRYRINYDRKRSYDTGRRCLYFELLFLVCTGWDKKARAFYGGKFFSASLKFSNFGGTYLNGAPHITLHPSARLTRKYLLEISALAYLPIQ